MRVLIVVDHRMFADAISSVLRDRGVEVVGVAETPADAIEIADRTRPDVVVVDVEIPDGRGLDVGREIMRVEPKTMIIALTSRSDAGLARQALAVGFRGCLTKDADTLSLVTAIRAVTDGGTVVPPHLAQRTLGRWAYNREEEMIIDQLTPRELEVVRMIAAAASSEEIADRLSISVNTVRSHIQSIFTKLQVHSRLEAVAFAARHGLLSAPFPMPLVQGELPLAAGDSVESSTA